ncbi:uncharacterized protein LOC117644029 [Thrips palmi]|uniref:Uncharacterized protein LOC117644029 n=1 Tax=Thrips palmi TaxID=161013 RepID=A0A6P8YPE1_THRPL|nr:uncharacterized protein LOC117644029 [Thrips palmi]
MKPANSLQEEKHTGGVCSEETLHPSDFKEPSIQIIKQACEVSNESWIEPAIETGRQPRQSILTKPSGLSLMPIDQNVTRKVRFADPSNKEEESQTSDQKTTFKHKLPRAPKPYKTRYIVSKELD